GQPESDQGQSRSRAAMGGPNLPASDPEISPPLIGVARHWILTDNTPGGFGQIHLRLVQQAGETGGGGIACQFCRYQVQLSNDHVQLRDLFVHIRLLALHSSIADATAQPTGTHRCDPGSFIWPMILDNAQLGNWSYSVLRARRPRSGKGGRPPAPAAAAWSNQHAALSRRSETPPLP